MNQSERFKFDLVQKYLRLSILTITMIEVLDSIPSDNETKQNLESLGLSPKKIFPKPIKGILNNTLEVLEKRTENLFNAFYAQFPHVAQTIQESQSFIIDAMNLSNEQMLYFKATFNALDKDKLDGTIKLVGNEYINAEMMSYINILSYVSTNEGMSIEDLTKYLQENISKFKSQIKSDEE